MKKYKLGEVAEIIGGVSYNKADLSANGIRILRGGNIQNGEICLKEDDVYLPYTYKDNRNTILLGDTIIVASTGSVEVLGKAATTFSSLGDVQIGAFLRIIRPKEPKYTTFIAAYLQSYLFRMYIQKQAKGTSINNIRNEHLINFTLYLPDESSLMFFSTFYCALDRKITLNRCLNHNLEVMAKLFYDYWFVQFNFPNTEYKPYKSSGGTMVWNDRLNRYIPANWGVGRLGDICDILLGGTPDTRNKSFWGGSYPWLNSGEVAEFPILKSEKSITEEGLNSSATAYAPKGCVVLSITRHLRSSILAIDACINQSVVAIKQTDEMRKEYLYPLISREIPRFMLLRTGAQQPHINKETVESTWIVIPPSTILEKYYAIASPIYCSIIKNAIEIENLIKLRNELLPLLMNGQVSINYDLSHD